MNDQRPAQPSDAEHDEGHALSATRYQTVVDVSNVNSSHSLLVQLCGEDKNVLEVGPATGYVSEALKARGCRVVAIEVDPAAAEVAAAHCDRMIVGDIEQIDLATALGDDRFDVVLFGDVLEHLVEPSRVVARVIPFLEPGGYVVASIPNVAHGAVRLALMSGQFTYTDKGLLDRTHLRFFDRAGVVAMFADAGLSIGEWRRVKVPLEDAEVELPLRDIPPHVRDVVMAAPEAMTYQFVVKAAPGPPTAPADSEGDGADPLRSFERWKEDADHLSERSAMLATELDVAWSTATEAAQAAAHATRNSHALLESKPIRAAAPIRAAFNVVRRLRGASTAAPAVEGHVDQAYYPRSRTKLFVTGWCWSSALRRPRIVLLVDGRRRAEWSPDVHRPDLAAELGIRRADIGFDAGVEVGPLDESSEISVEVISPQHRTLLRAVVGELDESRDPLAGRPPAVYIDHATFNRPPKRSFLRRGRAGLTPYEAWVQRAMLSPERLAAMKTESAALAHRPLISIVVPVYNTDPKWLSHAIGSVRQQVYENWELCLCDDASTRSATRRVLAKAASEDSRVKLTRLPDNRGIAAASNAAIDLASGEFVGFLDHDDELRPGALFEVAKLLNAHPETDFLFSDEDKCDEEGRLFYPFFKPGWSPHFLACGNYVTHFRVYRRSLLADIGGIREGYEGSEDFDLALRASEVTNNVGHIAWPLYSWRAIHGSTALAAASKPAAWEAGKRALVDAFKRRGRRVVVERGINESQYRVRHEIEGRPSVKIIIPTRDHAALLKHCVESVRSLSTWPNYHILVVDNDSKDAATLAYLEAGPFDVVPFRERFNFSRMMNLGVAAGPQADYVLFLNDDTEVITPDWIEAMLEHAQEPGVAAVGARLLFPDGRPQHEGIVVEEGPYNIDYQSGQSPLYLTLGISVRDCAAVTAACMLMRTAVFTDIDGYDEALDVAYNDVDLCLRALERGYVNVYTPYARLYHWEGSSRGRLHPARNTDLFEERWSSNGGRRDPYYNPRLAIRPPFMLGNDPY
jgi:GT2 family glycosyltransferase/2-polyprenyl-3-methyl-5-hydroxy-6-metoxy-1,4-benzoquinol methylase